MNTDLKTKVEQLAKETGKTQIEVITALQAAVAVTGNELLLDELCNLKWDYINTDSTTALPAWVDRKDSIEDWL